MGELKLRADLGGRISGQQVTEACYIDPPLWRRPWDDTCSWPWQDAFRYPYLPNGELERLKRQEKDLKDQAEIRRLKKSIARLEKQLED